MTRVILRKYKRSSNDHYIRCGKHFKKVDGKIIKIKGFENFDFFLHKKVKGKLTLWCISESVSGCRLTPYSNKINKVISNANSILKLKSKLELLKAINGMVDDFYLPPNFKFTSNPNKLKYVASKINKSDSLDDALRNRVRVFKK